MPCSIPRFRSFVGMYPIPARHGMTVGELATLFNQKYGLGVDLIVARAAELAAITMDRRDRAAVGEPVAQPALLGCVDELSRVGLLRRHQPDGGQGHRPTLRADRGVVAEGARCCPGHEPDAAAGCSVRSDHRCRWRKTAAKFKGQTIPAIRFVITDRQAYRPVRTSLLLIDEIRRQHPADFAWSQTIDRLTGSDKVRLAIEAGRLGSLLQQWDREAAEFFESRKPFLLYP